MRAPQSDDGLWSFSTRVYARPGVADACLTLQDDYGQDVLLLLFAAWMGVHGCILGPARLAQLDADASGWRGEVTQALRAVRRRLKLDPALASDPAVANLREDVKRGELAAERIALARMESATATWGTAGDRADPSRATRENLDCAFRIGAGSAPDPAAAALLAVIAEAATA